MELKILVESLSTKICQ